MYNKKLNIFLLILLSFLMFFNINVINVSASEHPRSNVLDDLKKDQSFNEADYPQKQFTADTDFSTMASLITISESEHNELYLYFYQPYSNSYPFELDSISMSLEKSTSGSYSEGSIKSYDLEFCNNEGALYKYVVKDFSVLNEEYRYYGFVAMWRPFIDGLDEMTPGAINQKVSISIGQQWCVYWLNDELIYEMGTFETLKLTPTFTGTFRFNNGITIGNLVGSFSWGDSHFICFNAENYIIKHIYDADMTYDVRSVTETWSPILGTDYYYGEYESKYITLYDVDRVSYKGDGLFATEYTWNRIMSSSEFIDNYKNQDISVPAEVESKIQSSQWVFSFAETQFFTVNYEGGYSNYYSECNDVTILRVHFLDINNKIYNLGTVMDKTTADNEADGNGGMDLDDFWQVFRYVLLIIGVILLLLIISMILPILRIILKVIIFIVKTIFKIVAIPFKLIGSIFTRKDEN